MDYVERVLDGVHGVLNLNAATLSGAIDIVVVPQSDHTLQCTPFHVRFGKMQLLNSSEKKVTIMVNDEEVQGLIMKLGSAGEAFFLQETQESLPPSLISSPIGSPPETPKLERKKSEAEEKMEMVSLTSKLEKLMEERQQLSGGQNVHPVPNVQTETEMVAEKVSSAIPIAREELKSSDGIMSSSPSDLVESPVGSFQGSLFLKPMEETSAEPELSWRWGSLPKISRPGEEKKEASGEGLVATGQFMLEEDSKKDLPSEPKSQALANSEGEKRKDSWSSKSLFRIFSRETADTTKEESSSDELSVRGESQSDGESEKGTEVTEHPQGNDQIEVVIGPESDTDNVVPSQSESYLNVKMSKCGHLLPNFEINEETERIFNENLLNYESFAANPEVFLDNTLIFKIEGKLYPWAVAGPLMVSVLVFRKPLDLQVLASLWEKYQMRVNASQKKGWGSWLWRSKPPQQVGKKDKEDSAKPPDDAPKIFKKTLKPTPEQLQLMKLRPGPNQIRFLVTSKLQGTREVRSTIYLWDRNVKMIISDIDGTITKSDVFGQILPIMGKDWSHSGVAELYSNISANNYQLLYLTARPIGQANITRGYISTLKQGDIRLPPGPVFMSPNRLLSSLNREVILRKPEEFKIACLKDIKSLFPKDSQPFYAGFGNRPTDAISYRTVGVPLGKIFTINYKGEISIVNYTYKKSFSTLNELVNAMFPTLKQDGSSMIDEEWNYWNYWKPPLPTALDEEFPLQ